MYLQAIWNNPQTEFNDGDLSSAYSQVYVDETLDKILDLTNSSKISIVNSVSKEINDYGSNQII